MFVKVVIIKTEEKTPQSKKRLILQPNNQKSIKSTMFQHMKIMLMLLSDLETLVKRFTCSKYLYIDNKRPIHIITRSPNQYPNYKTSTDIKPINKYKGSIVIFDDMLGARNSSQIDEFFTRGRHEDLDVYYISQSYFALPRQSIRNNSDRLILFKQTLRDVQSMYYDIGAYDMKYDEFKEMCYKAWSERFNYLCIDVTKNRDNGKYRIFNESKTTYIDCIPETEPF